MYPTFDNIAGLLSRPLRLALLSVLLAASCLAAPASGAGRAAAAPPSVATPQYDIRIHAFRTANDNGGEETIISGAQVKQWVDRANQALSAADAGITLIFDANESGPDWGGLLKNSRLNHMSNGDPEGQSEGNKIAARYPGKLVFFFRYAAGSGAGQNRGNGFANLNTNFVALPAFDQTWVPVETGNNVQNIWQLAHDFGHFLGLGHTFPGSSDDLTETDAKAAAYIQSHGGTTSALDGDGIADTPAEAGTTYFDKKGWQRCTGHDTYTIQVGSGARAKSLEFSPARHNIMSYFACEPMGFTAGQVAKMRGALQLPSRRLLIEPPCFPDFHNLPAEKFQLCFDYWVLRDRWPVTLAAYKIGNATHMAGSFQPGKNRPVRVLMTHAQYQQYFDDYKAQGFRPAQVNVLSTDTGPLYTAVWTPIDGAFESYHHMTQADFVAKWTQLTNAGYITTDLSAFQSNGLKFAATWVKRPHNGQYTYINMTSAEYTARFNELTPQGFQTTRFVAYPTSNGTRYAATWEKLSGAWYHFRDMTASDYQAKYNTYTAQGLALRHLSATSAASPRFSAIWAAPGTGGVAVSPGGAAAREEQAPCKLDFHNVPVATVQTCFDYYAARNIWLDFVTAYEMNGTVLMAGGFRPGASRPARGVLTNEQYVDYFNAYKAQGFRPNRVQVLSTDAGPRYSAVWAPVDGAWESYHHMTQAEFEAKWKQLRAANYLLIDLAAYRSNGLKFAATWVKRPFADYATYINMNGSQFADNHTTLSRQGMQLTHVISYINDGQEEYAAIWEKLPGDWARSYRTEVGYYQALYDTYTQGGYKLRYINAAPLDGKVRFTTIWSR